LENFSGVFAKLQCSNKFPELLNYFSIEKYVEYVYGAMDRVHRARRTGLETIIKPRLLATRLTAWIESTKGYLQVLIGAVNMEMSGGGPIPQREVVALGFHGGAMCTPHQSWHRMSYGARWRGLFGINNAAVTRNLT
jgi:hypothetical protein